MLPAETFEMTKHLLTISLEKPRQNVEAVCKTCDLLIYGDIHRITSLFYKDVQK